MKTILYAFLLLSGLSALPLLNQTNLAAQPTNKNKPSTTYKIQIAAYRNLNMAQLSPLADIGNLYAEDLGNGVKRVVMGYYKTETEAKNTLPKVHEKGFTTAYIAPHKENNIGNAIPTNSESPKENNSTSANNTNSEKKENDKPQESKTKIAQFTADDFPELKQGEVYAVILNATDEIITEKLPDLLDWGSVFVPQNDPDANMLLGAFETPEKALNALDYAQTQVSAQAKLCIIDAENFTLINNNLTIPPPIDNDTEPTDIATAPNTTTPPPTTDIAIEPPSIEPPKTDKPTPKDPCDEKNKTDKTTENTTATLPKQVEPEAIYRPHQPAKTENKEQQNNDNNNAQNNDNNNSENTNTNSTEPRSILSLPPEAIAGQLSEAPETATFSRLKTYFNNQDTATNIIITAYDPLLDDVSANADDEQTLQWDNNLTKINQSLKGIYIPAELVANIDSLPKNDPTWSFYALFKYALDPLHDAYAIRAGKGEYHNNNNIYLAVYDKGLGDFTQTMLISSVWGGGGLFAFKRSWITDLDKDGKGGDILTDTNQEFTDSYDGLKQSASLVAKVWKDGNYVEAQIVDEVGLRQQLGVK